MVKLLRRSAHILLTCIFIVLFPNKYVCGSDSRLKKGFEALKVYNYFEARRVFYEVNRKGLNTYACYGLASIYMRPDNPFYQLDSAVKYIHQGFHSFLSHRRALVLAGTLIDSLTLLELAESISCKYAAAVKREKTVASCERFLNTISVGKKRCLMEVLQLRDEQEFNVIKQVSRSDSTLNFIVTHPLSTLLPEARALYERQLYDECTSPNTAGAYMAFLKKHPHHSMRNEAYDRLFGIYRENKDIKGLKQFVETYPEAPQNLEAWKLLFSLSVKVYTYSELKNFLEVYPAFPLKNSILKELDLNKKQLLICQKGEYAGYIDLNAKFEIAPTYDEVTEFSEGLAVVWKGDSVFYINKENENPFNLIFSDAQPFRNGLAPVKRQRKWYFINRQGQTISKEYEEIRELSGLVYVVKLNERYGALDQFGQTVFEPIFEKLGDFSNDHAYYTENGQYGFVSRHGEVHKAQFEWISGFDEQHVSIIRQNKQYGLISAKGKVLLSPEYEQIVKAGAELFIVVTDNLYGFYNTAGCFYTPVIYEFMKEKEPAYYTRGNVLKLQKKGEQALVDLNGRFHVNFGVYEAINFAGNGLMMVKRKNRCGYVNTRLEAVVPFKYEEAGDFEDSLAIVKVKDKYVLIDTKGNELFSSGHEIKKIDKRYFLVSSEEREIINSKGITECRGVEQLRKDRSGALVVTLLNGEIKLLVE